MRRPRSFATINETASFAKPTNEKAECVHSFDKLAVLQFSEILPGRGIFKLNKLDKNGKKVDTKEDDFVNFWNRAPICRPLRSPGIDP
jgi:hypothetical protein